MGRLILVFAVLFFSAGCSRNPESRTQWMVKRISSTLDLDANQKAKLEEARLEFLKKQPVWEQQRKQAMANLAAALRSETPVDPAVLAALMEKCTERRDARMFMASNMAVLHGILRPEQREKMAKAMENMGHHHHF